MPRVTIQLPDDVQRLVSGELVGYLVRLPDSQILIDCPVTELPTLPRQILHTQVQEEHCREWQAAPEIPVLVPAGCRDLATLSPQFHQDCRTVWPPDRAWEYRGREPYGHTGCITARPPAQPLNIGGELVPGETWCHASLELEVMALPGSDSRAIGLYWREQGVLFSGDLLRAGGFLVNVYDTERDYGTGVGLRELRDSLARVLELRPRLLLPSTGDPITEPIADIESLIAGLTSLLEERPCRRAAEPERIINCEVIREFGRYREILPGLYQNNNFGAITLFVDDQGRGLMVDPDFCVWTGYDEACARFGSDLDLLERETGLKRVERACITHPHGDHMGYAGILQERYGTEIVTVREAAELLAHPEKYRYPGLLHWFGLPFSSFTGDRRLDYDVADNWHGVPVTPIWTPGHNRVHASYQVEWHGQRILCTGDFFQYGAGPISPVIPLCYSDVAWPERGAQYSLRRLLEVRPDYLLSSHSHCCHDPHQEVLRDFRDVYDEALDRWRDLLHDGDTMRAMTPPGYDELRAALIARARG